MADDFGGGFGDFGLSEFAGGLTDLPIGGLPSSMPLPDFSGAGNFDVGTSLPPSWMGADVGAPGGGDGGSPISGFIRDAMPFVGNALRLGVGGLGAYAGIQGLNRAGQQQGVLDRAQRTSEAAAAPGVAAAGKLIPAGTAALMGGPLPPELEAQVNTFINNAKMRARQTLAKMGLTNSDAAAQMDTWIDQQAAELRSKLAAGLLSSGTGAIPPGVTGQAGQLAANQGGQINQAIQEANRALFTLMGQQG